MLQGEEPLDKAPNNLLVKQEQEIGNQGERMMATCSSMEPNKGLELTTAARGEIKKIKPHQILYIGKEKYYEKFNTQVTICDSCQRIGHQKRNCWEEKPTCRYCSQERPLARADNFQRPNQHRKCTHWNGNHTSRFQGCQLLFRPKQPQGRQHQRILISESPSGI